MDPDHHRASRDLARSEAVRQRNLSPIDTYDLSNHNNNMTWVCSTMNEIIAARINLSEKIIVECDERALSLSPHRQTRATWCTKDLHALVIRIYEHYGPTGTKVEGPDRNGLSWVLYYKKTDFGATHGRSRQLVHVIWIKPGETLARRIHARVHSGKEILPKGTSSLDPDISGHPVNDGHRSAGASKDPKTLSLFDVFGPAALYPRRQAPRIPAIKVEAPSVAANRTTKDSSTQTNKPHAVELPAPNPMAPSPNSKLEARPYPSNKATSTKAEIDTEKYCFVPRLAVDSLTDNDTSSKRSDTHLAEVSPEKPDAKAEDEEWGIVSSISMESMDGDWTLVLDEDLC